MARYRGLLPLDRRIIAAIGRTVLSNYLMQSLVATTLFYGYGYGLGLAGEVAPALVVVVALGIYARQVLISQLWLRRFRFGPAEWLWRRLSYGRLQSVRGCGS